jgi:polygalacturonase
MKLFISLLNSALVLAALPPGPGPFTQTLLIQPVPGATVFPSPKVCDVTSQEYGAINGSNATLVLQKAINDCGDRPDGGVVLVPGNSPLTLLTASLFMRSNLTLRVEKGATLLGTATGSMKTPESINDAPMMYVRRNSLMVMAHAGFINGGACLKINKDAEYGSLEHCMEWTKLQNVIIEGGGTLDANSDDWYGVYAKSHDSNTRPMMLDLMWIDGLTISGMQIRRPGYWTVHPCFSNNVRVESNSIITYGSNTDGCDPDSTWNVYIAHNTFSTGDDCIAIKAGRDLSGRQVNISTQNVLAEQNSFLKGHGVSIGSETSGWIRNITIRDSKLDGTNLAVRIKTMRGRGGGVEDVLYENLEGKVVGGVQLTLNYKSADPTNISATPVMRRITLRNIHVEAKSSALTCDGLPDSIITDIVFDNVTVTGSSKQSCDKCAIKVSQRLQLHPLHSLVCTSDV